MTQAIVRWRPLGSLDIESVIPRLALALEDWRAAWFVRETFGVDCVEVSRPGETRGEQIERWYETPEIALGVLTQPIPLIDRALDFAGRRPKSVSGDNQLLQQFEHAMIAELLRTTIERLGSRQSDAVLAHDQGGFENSHGGLYFKILDGAGQPVIAGVLKHALVTAFVGFPQSKDVTRKVDDRAANLAGARIPLSLLIGQTRLPIQQLMRLEPGDVVVLETGLADNIELVEEIEGSTLGSGHIYQNGEHLQFRLEPSSGQRRS